jgi:hypothetical protein
MTMYITCLHLYRASISVSLGINDLDHPDTYSKSLTSTVYAANTNYNASAKSFDIGLIRLPTPVVLNDAIRTICLPKDSENFTTRASVPLVATGWGLTLDNSCMLTKMVFVKCNQLQSVVQQHRFFKKYSCTLFHRQIAVNYGDMGVN